MLIFVIVLVLFELTDGPVELIRGWVVMVAINFVVIDGIVVLLF